MSDPEVKKAVLMALQHEGATSAPSPRALQNRLGLSHFSHTKFWAAVRSLHYKPGAQCLKLTKRWSRDTGTQMWSVVPL